MSGVRGQLELRRVARLLRDVRPELRREMARKIRMPVKPFSQRVRAEVAGSVPARYAGVLAPAIRTSLSTGLSLSYMITVYARGKGEDRDVRAVNAGVLRHKTWGRDPWHAQQVRGGFVDRAVDDLGRQVARGIEEAVDEMAAKIAGG